MDDKAIGRFETLLHKAMRPGFENLTSYIQKSDFYSAPASTRYHSCHDGGLLEHSLNVYDRFVAKAQDEVWKPYFDSLDYGSAEMIALLHDICKTYFYSTELKNKKVYSESGSKSDSNGRYDWMTVPAYAVDDKVPYGHGEKSVMIIEEFVKLTPVERYCIRWHMGFTEPKDNWNTLAAAIKKYPLILALNEADLESTYILERDE